MRQRTNTQHSPRRMSAAMKLGTALAGAVLLAGCAAPAVNSDGAQGSDGVVDKITIRLADAVSVFDPAINSGNSTQQIRILTTGLLYRQDADGLPQPELVESTEISDDGLTQTMTLKPDLSYSDDTPLVAQDVVAIYEHAVVQRAGGSAFFTPFVESVEAPDDHTVVWHLKVPYAQLPMALANGEVAIHPNERIGDEGYFLAPVSAGPYVIEDFSAGDQVMHLVENPNYVGGDLMVTAIDSVVVADITQAALQLTSGQLDFAWGLSYASAEAAESTEGVEVIAHPTGGVFQFGMNPTEGGPLADPDVRKAIALAVDRESISEKAWLGYAEPNPAWVFATSPEFEVALPDDGEPDLDAARELLAGTEWADGFEFTMDTFGVRDGHTATVTLLKEQLAELGITVIVNPLEVPTAVDRLNNNDFDAFFQGSVAPSAASVLVVDNCASGVWGRWMPTGDPEICELALQAMGEDDPSASLATVQEMMSEHMTIVPIVNRRDIVASRVPQEIFSPVANTPWLYVATQESMGVAE
jgi:peptide/nickel transport system substrate-binding protein